MNAAQGKWETSLSDFKRAIGLDAGYSAAYRGIADSCQEQGDQEGALFMADEGDRSITQGCRDYRMRGETLCENEKPELGMADLTEATTLSPLSSANWLALGLAQKEAGKESEAIDSLSRAIKQDDRSAPALVARGKARLKEDDVAGALADFTAASKDRSQEPRLLAETRIRSAQGREVR